MIKHTGHELEKIEKDTDRDRFMTAEEARDYRLIDQVIEIFNLRRLFLRGRLSSLGDRIALAEDGFPLGSKRIFGLTTFDRRIVMKVTNRVIVGLVCLVGLSGCQQYQNRITLLQQELRLYEDRVYQLQDRVRSAESSLADSTEENKALRAKLEDSDREPSSPTVPI